MTDLPPTPAAPPPNKFPPPPPFAVLQAAVAIESLTDPQIRGELSLPHLVAELNDLFEAADSGPVASLLAVHAQTLNAVFNRLLASPDRNFNQTLQIGMALRAQRQCLDTLHALQAVEKHKAGGA